jgi:hypothetical protein
MRTGPVKIVADDVIKACNLLISPNKGISLHEEAVLRRAPKVDTKNKLNSFELVNVAQKMVYHLLGRKNITARDLKKAIFHLIDVA